MTLNSVPIPHDFTLFTDGQYILSDVKEANRLINGYIAFMKRSKRGEKEPGMSLSIREDPVSYAYSLDSEFPDNPNVPQLPNP